MVTVRRITNLEEWSSLEVSWEDLLARASRSEIFLSHRWLTGWFRYFGERDSLHTLIVMDDSKWIGAVALIKQVEKWHGIPVRTLRFPINQESGNLRGDFILSTKKEETIAALIRELERTANEWDRWDLSGLPVGSPAFPILYKLLSSLSWQRNFWKFLNDLSYLPISGSWEEYCKTRNYKFRRNLKQCENRMGRLGVVSLRVSRTPEEISKAINEIFELDSRSTKAMVPGVIRLDGAVQDFYRYLAETFGVTGDCRIDTLQLDDISVAVLISFYSHGVLFFLYTSYDQNSSWLSPGRILFGKVLQDLWKEGLHEADFNGMTSFVRTWTSRGRANLTCTQYNSSFRSLIIHFWEQAISPAVHRAIGGLPVIPLTPLPLKCYRSSINTGEIPLPLMSSSCTYYENGRTALYFGLMALPLQEGDEILFPSYHCGSELEVLLHKGVKPCYYPVGLDLAVSVDVLQSAFTQQTKAVYVIHYMGWPQNIIPIAEFCRKNQLFLIEDCAQTLYSSSQDVPIGQVGDLAIFSLHKFLPLPDGGAAVFNQNPTLQPNQGATPSWRDQVGLHLQQAELRYHYGGSWKALVGEFTYHMISAIAKRTRIATHTPSRVMSENSRNILLGIDHQLVVDARRANYRAFLELFKEKPGVRALFPTLEDGVVPLLFPIMVEYPWPLLQAMEQAGIEAGILWSSVHPAFPLDEFQEVAYLKSHLVVLPVHQELTHTDFLRIENAVACYTQDQCPPDMMGSVSQPVNTV